MIELITTVLGCILGFFLIMVGIFFTVITAAVFVDVMREILVEWKHGRK